MIVTWDHLSLDEKEALERLFTDNRVLVPRVTADRLISLGLADRRSGSVGISLAGEDLIVQQSQRDEVVVVEFTNWDAPSVKLKRQPE